jgi:hypothetical protein
MRRSQMSLGAVAADTRGDDSLRPNGERLKKGAHGGNMVSPVRETLRLGLRGDTLKEALLDGERAPAR